MRVPWTARRSNQSILMEISPEYSLEGLMLKLKLQCFGHLVRRTDSMEKILMLGKIEGRRRRGQQRTRWLDIITDSMDVSLSKLQEMDNKRCLIVDVVSDSLPFHGLQHAGLPCPSPYPRAFSNAGQVVWYSQLFQNFPPFIVIHSQRLWHSQ